MLLRSLILLLSCVLLSCRSQAPPAATASIPHPERSFLDLAPGWRLTLITPLRRDSPSAPWRYGQPKTSGKVDGLSVELQLDPAAQFGFERSTYAVLPDGLRWQESRLSLQGEESSAPAPVLPLFPPPQKKQQLRLLFLTRASAQNYNTALLSASSRERLEMLTTRLRTNPDESCRTPQCIWIPLGVAARPEKPDSTGRFVPAF